MKCPFCPDCTAWYVCPFCLLTLCHKHLKRPKHACSGEHDIQAEMELV